MIDWLRALFARPYPTDDIVAVARDDAEWLAWEDYTKHVGRVVRVGSVLGYVDSDSDEHYGDYVVEILPTVTSDVVRWMDKQHLDPNWDVRILSGPMKGALSSTWIYGRTVRLETEA